LTDIYWGQGTPPFAQTGTKCVIGLDRDGVINRDLGTYVTDPKDFDPLPQSLEAVALLRSKGHKIAIITNQGGIEKGLMTQNDVDVVHQQKFSKGFYVGDKISDLKAAVKIGARPVLVRTGYGVETESKLEKFTYKKLKKQTYIFDNLWEFASAI